MPAIRQHLRFILNGEDVSLTDVAPDATLLDFLRLERSLKGTKEGCAEGDCGACTVLVGRLGADGLVYESVNACIRFVGSLDATHVVTIEHLRGSSGALHPVQQAMVDCHGSQCGFCTPGFVMSLYALWMRDARPAMRAIEGALQGNLCRCTGYEAIIRAAQAIASYGEAGNDPLIVERAEITERLRALRDGARVDLGGRLVVPASVNDLAAIFAENPNVTLVAGSTDVGLWVTKYMRPIEPVVFIGGLDELKRVEERDGVLRIGAGVTYSEARDLLVERIPELGRLISRIGGEQVRNMGTLGGNIANGSPIGDMPPPLIALGARVILRNGSERRELPLEDFFLAYGKQDRQPGEFLEALHVPLPDAGTRLAFHKVTKRRDEDITATLGAFAFRLDAGNRVAAIRIAYGGMAGTPQRARAVEQALLGQPWTEETVLAAMDRYEDDFTPLTDMRASAEYRMLAARNLLMRVYLESVSGDAPVSVARDAAA
ncbi:MAG: xanthine dehydrogenase small subunit [Methylobacterium mesophilicum]|nr:xanthine dehydrogenase small subunit [Methylobacterium mesophilicum]